MKKKILSILSLITGFAAGAGIFGKIENKARKKEQAMSEKHLALFLMMNQWVQVKQEGKDLADYFEKNGYKSIAIYGMSYAGERLVHELSGSNIAVKYGIDKNAAGLFSDIDIVTPEARLEDVDAVVVTPIFFMDTIEEMLSRKVSCPIISLEDILYEI